MRYNEIMASASQRIVCIEHTLVGWGRTVTVLVEDLADGSRLTRTTTHRRPEERGQDTVEEATGPAGLAYRLGLVLVESGIGVLPENTPPEAGEAEVFRVELVNFGLKNSSVRLVDPSRSGDPHIVRLAARLRALVSAAPRRLTRNPELFGL